MYNLKIKNNTPYPIILIEVGLPPIEKITMTRYLLYKCKKNDTRDQRLPKIALKFNQDHLRLKKAWHKDNVARLNHWGINKNETAQNINNMKILSHLSLKRNWGAI